RSDEAGGAVVGWLAAEVSLQLLFGELMQAELGRTGSTTLATAGGDVLVTPDAAGQRPADAVARQQRPAGHAPGAGERRGRDQGHDPRARRRTGAGGLSAGCGGTRR